MVNPRLYHSFKWKLDKHRSTTPSQKRQTPGRPGHVPRESWDKAQLEAEFPVPPL